METDPIRTLTKSQKEVLRLVHAGMTTKEMARHLGLSIGAVDDRVEGARAKLGHVRRATAARLLAAAEASPMPFGVDPKPLGVGFASEDLHEGDVVNRGDAVKEDRAVFAASMPPSVIEQLGPLERSGIGIAFAVLFLAFTALIKPMIDGIAWVTTTIEPFFE